MEFPVTIDSQEDFDKLIKPRLDREKTKHADLETQAVITCRIGVGDT